MEKIKDLKSARMWTFGTEVVQPRTNDLYTGTTSIELFDYDRSLGFDIKVLNGTTFGSTQIAKSDLIRDIFYGVEEETFKFIAMCEYGCTKGNFFEGMTCPKCGTMIKTIDTDVLKFRFMFQVPDEYPPIIHPIAYNVLSSWLGTRKKVNLMEAMLFDKKIFPIELTNAGFKFGLAEFYNNFDALMEWFFTSKFLAKKKATNPFVKEMLTKYRDRIFIRNVPILNKTLHMITKKKGSKKKSSDSQAGIIMQMYHILERLSLFKPKRGSDVVLCKFALAYYRYLDEIIKTKCSRKTGYILQNVTAGRFHNTFRGVITPITIPHMGDELHLPWAIGVANLKLEILNLLKYRYKYTREQALNLYYASIDKYNPIIHECMNTLISECVYKGLPVLWHRNPTMKPGGMQLLFVPYIKPDPDDKTIGMSQMIINAPNADQQSVPPMSNCRMVLSLIAGTSCKTNRPQ